MAGHSASKDARERAYVPAIHVLLADIRKERRGCRAGKFTQPAQAWLRARAWRSKRWACRS